MKIKTQRAIVAYIGGMLLMLAFTNIFKAYQGNPLSLVLSPISLILGVGCFIYALRR